MSFEDIFTDHWLPAKPLCADRKNGSYKRQTRARALEHAYIETNPLAMQSLIVTDHDGADADYIADLAGLQSAFTLHGLHGVVRDGVRLCFDEECFGDC